jgi:uroporphyrinogen III methyltransferase/synthase
MTVRPGTVYLVGAGPGDPGLITVRGLELLQRADVILHDRLLSDALLAQAPATAELIDVGKTPWGQAANQEEINAALVAHATRGRIVVRLKGGDPLVFGRGWEEREACRRAGVICEIVPGISSALAGPAAADIPVTCRGVASSVAIAAAPVIGRRELEAIAHADTCVFLMGMRDLPELARRLMEYGRAPETPAAVIERATLPGQRTVRARLDKIADAAAAAGLQSPAVIVVGATAALGTNSAGPLAGRRIVVTRPLSAAHHLTSALRALGAEVIAAPLIQIGLSDPGDTTWLERIGGFDWIVFSSRHAVRGFRRAVEKLGADVRRLAHARVAVVGPITARELETWGIRPDLLAEPARADALVRLLLAQEPRPQRVLFPCGTLALETIPTLLAEHGIAVERLPVYETKGLLLDSRTRQCIENGVDAVLLASPSAAVALGQSRVTLGSAVVVCIGPTTAEATATFRWPDVRVASVHSDAGMTAATLSALGAEVLI